MLFPPFDSALLIARPSPRPPGSCGPTLSMVQGSFPSVAIHRARPWSALLHFWSDTVPAAFPGVLSRGVAFREPFLRCRRPFSSLLPHVAALVHEPRPEFTALAGCYVHGRRPHHPGTPRYLPGDLSSSTDQVPHPHFHLHHPRPGVRDLFSLHPPPGFPPFPGRSTDQPDIIIATLNHLSFHPFFLTSTPAYPPDASELQYLCLPSTPPPSFNTVLFLPCLEQRSDRRCPLLLLFDQMILARYLSYPCPPFPLRAVGPLPFRNVPLRRACLSQRRRPPS